MDNYHELYPVNEYFLTIQGEGNHVGLNSLFIRFHFCNLTCTWCDTKYTWIEGPREELVFDAEKIKQIISDSEPKNIILTGGEPALFRLDKLVVPGKNYHVETNGTIIPVDPVKYTFKSSVISRDAMNPDIINKFNWVVSPKLSNSRQEINEKSLLYWINSNFCIFKFIIRNLSDLKEVSDLQQNFNIDKNKIYIGLEGQTPESQIQPALVDEIIRCGYNFSPRLHVILWGNRRGK